MSFQNLSVNASSGASIPIIDHSQSATGSVGVGMYPSLMGSFSCPAPILMIVSSFGGASSSLKSMSFCTTHMEDPWILSTPSTLSEPIVTDALLPATMVAYHANLEYVVEPSPSSSRTEEEDPYVLPTLAVQSSHAYDYLDSVFPSDKAIIEAMSGVDHHGKSSIIDLTFFPSLTAWSMRNLGSFLERELVVPWFR